MTCPVHKQTEVISDKLQEVISSLLENTPEGRINSYLYVESLAAEAIKLTVIPLQDSIESKNEHAIDAMKVMAEGLALGESLQDLIEPNVSEDISPVSIILGLLTAAATVAHQINHEILKEEEGEAKAQPTSQPAPTFDNLLDAMNKS